MATTGENRKTTMRPRTELDLPLLLDRTVPEPLTTQLTRQLRATMRDGRLVAGERLPSSRALAATLGVSRTVVTETYQQLYAEGWLDGRHGSGTYVAGLTRTTEPEPPRTSTHPIPRDLVLQADTKYKITTESGDAVDLRPGVPWVGGLDNPAWRRAWRLAASVVPAARPDPYGLPGLRAALIDYVRRTRGIACTAEQVLVTRGATNGFDLLAATVLGPGDRVGVEEPGYGRARAVLAARGAEAVPCPVDEHGLIVDGLPDDLRVIYTTPSHQYPLGGVLPVPRRQALVAWARRTGALIAEDDYDSEFRYDVGPLPALYGLDPEVVVYLGTASKTLTPDVGVGWLVARPDLVEAIARRREEVSDRTPIVPQEAVRILVARGDLDRHVRRMRAEYARRRATIVDMLGGLALSGDSAGLHLVVRLPHADGDQIVRDADRDGVLLDPLERHFGGPATASGLVIGYGGARLRDIKRGCALIRSLISPS
jgi:GntR family transcriptional regulator/MocR family aminotransferase